MKKVIFPFTLIILLSALYLYLHLSGKVNILQDSGEMRTLISSSGHWGPLLIVVFMTAAIVMSPIPSAPIAITSGYLYGHTWGTIYILIGAEAGALLAFSMARMLGYETMQKRFGDKINFKYFNSGRNIAMIVCISRLIPFISFDIVSYAAGLTRISYLQFAIATFIGIIPASFMLAHFGGELHSDDLTKMLFTILILGMITVVPLLGSLLLHKARKENQHIEQD